MPVITVPLAHHSRAAVLGIRSSSAGSPGLTHPALSTRAYHLRGGRGEAALTLVQRAACVYDRRLSTLTISSSP